MSILDNAKQIAELIKKYKDQDLYERIVALREEILEIREENITLKHDLKTLKEASSISARLRRDGNSYFLDDDTSKTHPYCLTCWDADRKLVSLILTRRNGTLHIRCGICSARNPNEKNA